MPEEMVYNSGDGQYSSTNNNSQQQQPQLPPLPTKVGQPTKQPPLQPSSTPQTPGFYYASNYVSDDGVTFDNSCEASITTYGSLFGISAIELHVEGMNIRGTGSVAVGTSGMFWGILSYNDIRDVTLDNKYQLVCQQNSDTEQLYMYFVQPPEMNPKAMFIGKVSGIKNREFSGVFQFNQTT